MSRVVVPSGGALTRSMILDRIRVAGRISRVELAEASGLTQTAISNIVRQTITDGLVIETGFGESTGGKRRTLLEINVSARHALGVSLDQERMIYVACDLSGQMVGRISAAGTGLEQPGAVVPRMATELRALLDLTEIDPSSVVGLGVASPGPLNSPAGVLLGRQPNPAWRDFPLREELAKATGLPVMLDSDASCAALGEFWTTRNGATSPVNATVYMADGIGCGIIVDGRVFHGASSNAGELGHLSLDVDGPPCACGARGCVELYAAPRAVVAAALADRELATALDLRGDPVRTRSDFARIVRSATHGDDASLRLVTEAARRLGQGIVTLGNVLDLDEISLSGPGFADGGALFAQVIQQQLDQLPFTRDVHSVAVRISHIGTEAAALGAAARMLQQEVTPHTRVGRRLTSAAR
ncbi:ROK family transcriptional regulator [Pseudactinotalea terrae]|uniref:ROK family transcriptional regulator n=1 Tax=Pseudactinotalea terrae TaxID=1743262 RepID=UPI0012E2FC76|nr:ROK family transcriptional regulator [Pseudactinotalea terrae]